MSYTLIKQINPQHVHLKFKGPFQGNTVTWNTQFLTLSEYNRNGDLPTQKKQIIDIREIDTDMFDLTVALNITKINESAIEKMIIMIRQYKNLSTERHEYG